MRYPWIDEYLMAKRAVTKDLQPEWNWIRYKIGEQMFAAVLLDPQGRPIYLNVKLDPLEGAALRQQYRDNIPGYYSDKRCWNSVLADGSVPDGLLKKMLDTSYRLVLQGFSRKKQREILGLSPCGADCAACGFYRAQCPGCNECCGQVFHQTEGEACPLYRCPVQKHRQASCAFCPSLPCDLWRATRDPRMTEEEFEQSIGERIARLRGFP